MTGVVVLVPGTVSEFEKSPFDNLDYQVDYQYWLAEAEVIAASEWVIEPGVLKTNESFVDTNATVWLSGGADGSDYTVVNRVTTDQGRKRQLTLVLLVRIR